jgi:hypothetical protein
MKTLFCLSKNGGTVILIMQFYAASLVKSWGIKAFARFACLVSLCVVLRKIA